MCGGCWSAAREIEQNMFALAKEEAGKPRDGRKPSDGDSSEGDAQVNGKSEAL